MSAPSPEICEGRVPLAAIGLRRLLFFVAFLGGAFFVLILGSSSARADDGLLGSADLPAAEDVVDAVSTDVSSVAEVAAEPVSETVDAVEPVTQPVVKPV